jgi:hypothetical protein
MASVTPHILCAIPGFRREVTENCALLGYYTFLGYYTERSDNFLPS